MRRHLVFFCAAFAVAAFATKGDLDLDELGCCLVEASTGSAQDITLEEVERIGYTQAKLMPVARFAERSGISTNAARDAIYDLLKRDWSNAAMYYGDEFTASRTNLNFGARGIALSRSRDLEYQTWYADLVYTESKREELRHMALVSSNSAIRAEGLRMTLESPALSTNSLYEIHDALASAPLCAWTFQTLWPLSTEQFRIRTYPANSNLWRKAAGDAVFKDRLNRLDWFIADAMPFFSTRFDERLAASVPGYDTSIQRLSLYARKREEYFSQGKTNIWNECSKPVFDRLNALAPEELNDVSNALAW